MSKVSKSTDNYNERLKAQKSVCSLLEEHTNNKDRWYTAYDNSNHGNVGDCSNNKLQDWWKRSTDRLKQSQNLDEENKVEDDNDDNIIQKRMKLLRKASVAVAGGTMVGVGIPLIPLPGPGELIVVGGVALLATEFPAAQKLLDDARDKVADLCEDEDQKQGEKSSIQRDDELTEINLDTLKTGARWVGKQMLPILDHFTTDKKSIAAENTNITSNHFIQPEGENKIIALNDDVIDSPRNIHWM